MGDGKLEAWRKDYEQYSEQTGGCGGKAMWSTGCCGGDGGKVHGGDVGKVMGSVKHGEDRGKAIGR